MSVRVSRSITAYGKETEMLAIEQDLEFRDFATLFSKCGAPREDPELFNAYPIKREDVSFYAVFLPASFAFDHDRFDYFLEASAI